MVKLRYPLRTTANLRERDDTMSRRKSVKSIRKENRMKANMRSKKRTCRKCGQIIEGPNYFFCDSCHRTVSKTVA